MRSKTKASKRLPLDLLLLLLWLAGIGHAMQQPVAEAPTTIPDVEVLSNDATLRRAGGVLYYGGQLFSGRLVARYDDGARKSVTRYDDGARKSVTPYDEGKAHGMAQGWYPGGVLMYERTYQTGKKEGVHTGWWEDGSLKFVYHFKNDVHEGQAYTWFRDGALYRDFNYKNGKEAGSQRMWNEDGTIKTNYVIKDGRRYGLLGSKPCVNEF